MSDLIEIKEKEVQSREIKPYTSEEKKDREKTAASATSPEDVEGYTRQIEDWISKRKKGKKR